MVSYGEGLGAPRASASADSLSIPWLVGASFLIGVGIFCLAMWIITNGWALLGGAVLLVVGALMLFNPRAGSDRSP